MLTSLSLSLSFYYDKKECQVQAEKRLSAWRMKWNEGNLYSCQINIFQNPEDTYIDYEENWISLSELEEIERQLRNSSISSQARSKYLDYD